MELREEFARNLRKYRRQRQLSQEALANEAGIDRTYISSLERGVYSASVDMIEKLANVLSIEPAALLERSTKPGPKTRTSQKRSEKHS
ncbi:MAG: helix-turn-helix domain-containing protein [Pseudomonadota bacterium]